MRRLKQIYLFRTFSLGAPGWREGDGSPQTRAWFGAQSCSVHAQCPVKPLVTEGVWVIEETIEQSATNPASAHASRVKTRCHLKALNNPGHKHSPLIHRWPLNVSARALF